MEIISLTNSHLRGHKSVSDLSVVKEVVNAPTNEISSNSLAVLSASDCFIKIWRSSKKQDDDSMFEVWKWKHDECGKTETLRSSEEIKGK